MLKTISAALVAGLVLTAGAVASQQGETYNLTANLKARSEVPAPTGVPANAVAVEGASATTEENAQRVAELMKTRGLVSAILVTSPYHQRRAAMLFEREFARAALTFTNHPADDPDWDPNLWWTSDPSRSRTLVELAKLGALVAGQRGG